MISPLTGKLFDETGERLTPSHAVKGNRRYRYYVSRSLMKGPARKFPEAWRIPALEIERLLAAELAKILDKREEIVGDLDHRDLDAREINSILQTAAQWSNRLRSEEESCSAMVSLIDRAELGKDGIALSIKLPIPTIDKSSTAAATHLSLTRHIPLGVKRRGIEMRLISVGGTGSVPRVDPAILKAVARAQRWFAELVSGRSISLDEIGKREGIGKRYVSRIIRLAFLAPSIIEDIVAGHQPPDLTAQALSTRPGDLPLSWQAQMQLLGFENPV